ncbi:hypothetical protein C0991_002165 [Blastosporella zonata]|nr:hypothetical protein C0991_002165 [Blastosporella zonata]
MSTSSGSQLPNIAVVPLPPGFTVEQFSVFQSNLDGSEVGMANLGSLLVGLIVSQIAAIIATATTGIAFGYRAMGVWGIQHKGVAGIVGALWIMMVGWWIAVAQSMHATNGAATPFGSNCQITPFVSWMPLSHGLSSVFYLTVLVLMLAKIKEQREHPSSVIRVAYSNSLTLMAIATGASITILIVHCLKPDYQLAKQISLPFSTLITVTMGARIFIILRIAPAIVTPGRTPPTNIPYAIPVARHPDGDKVAYEMHAAPVPPPNFKFKHSPRSSFTAFSPLSPKKYMPAHSPSSSSFEVPSPHPPFASPHGLSVSIPHTSSASRVPPKVIMEPQHNPYTMFPDPPSPPQVPQIMVRDGSIDAETPLLKTFNVPFKGTKKPKLKKEDDYTKSGWMGAFSS